MDKLKVLVLGATGMAGHIVYSYLNKTQQYDVSNMVFRSVLNDDSIVVDVTNKELLKQSIYQINPDVIVNCIGVLISGSDDNPSNAVYVNACFPHLLSTIANEINSKLIHISTDCVFSGKKGNYLEKDFRDADDVYGRSKALGEINNGRHLTIRTSIIGPEIKQKGEGLFHWFMKQTGTVNGFSKMKWSGVTTLELAKSVIWAIECKVTGLYHLTNNNSINKYELLNLFKKYTQKDIVIREVEGKEIDKTLIDTRLELNYIIPSYDKMVAEMVTLIKEDVKLYRQYQICEKQ